MCIEKLVIKSNIRNYDVFFENDSNFLSNLATKENTIFIIDENVWNLHKNSVLSSISPDRLIIQHVCEEIKNLATVCELYDKIMAFSPRKNLTLVSIGGGITQDITGFVASSLYRGINWIFIPTTLLAQVDSCIGAKTSLNYKNYKNLVGTFYPPSQVHIYPEFLKTLRKEDYYSGVGEMAKLHIMNGEKDTQKFIDSLKAIDELNFDTLLNRTRHCLEIKKSYIEDDEFDIGKRNMLNYGHCFGHAIETSTNFAISHGQAVVLGMILANKIALRQNLMSKDMEEYLYSNVLDAILVVDIPIFNIEKIIEAMKQDKKNTGNGLALVMLENGYQMTKITNLNPGEVVEVLEEFNKNNINRM